MNVTVELNKLKPSKMSRRVSPVLAVNVPPVRRVNKGKSKNKGSKTGLVTVKRAPNLEILIPDMPLFAATAIKRTTYSTSFSFTTTGGTVTSYVFACNGLFDPDITGTGHQSMGFDQMMIFFNHYTVLRSKIRVTFRNQASQQLTCGVRLDSSPTPLTVIDRLIESGGGGIEFLGNFGSTRDVIPIEVVADIPHVQGVSRSAVTADPTLRGDASTNPTELSYFHAQIWDSGGKTGSVLVDVLIDFTSVYTEPRDPTESVRYMARFAAKHGCHELKTR